MAHITVNIPVFRTVSPRGVEFLADLALFVSNGVARIGKALLSGLGSRHLLVRSAGWSDEDKAGSPKA